MSMRQRIGRRLISIMLSVLMLVSLLPTAVFAEELQNQTTAGVTEQVGGETGNTVKNSNENEGSTGGEEAKGESSTTYVAKVGDKEYATLGEAIVAAEDKGTIILNAESYDGAELSSLSNTNKAVTIKAAEGVTPTFDMPKEYGKYVAIHNATVTFEGITFKYGNADYVGLAHAADLTYNSCTIEGKVSLYAKSETFNNCTFNQTISDYNVWTYGAMNVEFNGCIFNNAGKTVNVYIEKGNASAEVKSIKAEDCTVNSSADDKAFLNIKNASQSYDVTFTGTNTVKIDGAKVAEKLYQVEQTAYSEDNKTTLTVKEEKNGVLETVYEVKAPVVNYIDLDTFIKWLENSSYSVDGANYTNNKDAVVGGKLVVKWSPVSGCYDTREGHECTVGNVAATGNTPKRVNNGLTQFQLFEGENVNVAVKNVKFVYEPAAFTVCENSNWRGSFTKEQAPAGQLYFMTTGDVNFEGCTFDKVVLTSFNTTGTTTVKNCEFANVYNNYAIKDIRGANISVTDTKITNCGGGIMVSSTDKVEKVTIWNNTFTNVDVAGTAAEGKAGTRGLIQIAKSGTYTNTNYDFSNNTATNCGPVLRQLNESVKLDKANTEKLKELGKLYTSDSLQVASVGGVVYPTLEAAFAALSTENHTLTLIKADAWAESTPVYWKAGDSEYTAAAKLTDALTAAYKADAGDITIVCRPGADVGTMTHGHVADNITIYGNDAYISGGECDLEVDTFKFSRETGAQANDGEYLTKDIAINAYELDNLGVWGERHTTYEVNVNLTDCDGKAIAGKENVQRVYISGTTGVNNITLTGCNFLTAKTAVYSNANGAIVVDGCSFTGTAIPVNINHKAGGDVTVEVKNSTFTGCGSVKSGEKQYAAPIRFVNSGSGTMQATVDSCSITGTKGTNGDILIGDGRTGQASNDLSLKVTETTGQVQVQKPGYWITNNRKDPANETHFDVASTATFETSIKRAFITATTGTETDPYTLEQFNEMTRAEYIAAQDRLGGTMYVTVGEYAYATQGVLGNGTADNSDRDSTKLNYYGAPGAKEGQYSDAAVGKSVVFVGDSIENEAEGYTDIDRIGTSLLLAVPAYTNVTFKGIDFYGVFSFNYQLYTSPWSQLGSLNFEGCTFNGLIVGAIAAQTLKFEGCTFNEYSNSASTNNSNPIWVRPAYGNWTKDDNEGQGENFKSLTTIAFTGNTVNSTRPVKFERIAQWEMDTKVTATDNTFNIRNDGSGAKNVGMYFGANAKFDLVVDNNKASSKTAGLYTAVYSAPNGTNYPGLPAGSTVKDSNGETSVDALVWKSTDKLTLKTTEEVAQLTTTKGVVKFATLQEAIAEAKDGDTVKLLKDVTEDVTISKGITLDLGGKTLTNTNAGKATVTIAKGATATVQNGSIIGGTSYYNIQNNGTATFTGVTATAGNTGSSMIDNFGTLTIKSGTYTGGMDTVKNEPGAKLTISGGEFTLTKGTSKGFTGVVFNYGVLEISGGTFIQSDKNASYGQAQVIHTDKSGSSAPSTVITGGTFKNLCTRSTAWVVRETNAAAGATKVSGGTFNKSISDGYCADGYGVYQTGTGKYEAMTTRVAKIGDKYYETLEGAVNAATAGQTVTLVTDVAIANQLVINKKLTLNLNKKTLTSTYSIPQSPTSERDRYALVNDAELTIRHGTFEAGQARAIGAYAALTLSSATVTQELRGGHACVAFCGDDTAYTIRSSKIDGAYAVCSFANNATINISRSTLIGTGNTLYHNGSNYGLKLTVKDTTITSSSTDSCGVYISGSTDAQSNTANQNGAGGYQEATFTNCTISGANGVEVKYTDLTLDNCTVEATVETPRYTQNNNGPAGVGFAVVSTDNAKNGETPKPEGKITVTGENGHYTGPVGLGSLESVKTGYPNFADKTIDISAGTFSCAVPEDYCADGFIPTKNADGTYGVKAGKYVAEVKGAKYETLQEAVDAAKNTTVKMLADTKENVTISTRNLTLDLNGFTLNGGTEKGKPALTVTARMTVIKDGSTAQTGTIMREDTAENSGVSSHYVIDIQGNGWLTFEGGNVKNNSGIVGATGASLVRVGDDSVAKYPGLTIKGGTFTQDNFIVIKVDRGDLFLNGGTLNSANTYAVENWFRATIKGGTVNGAVSSWTYSSGSNSTLTISGGTINGDVTSVNYGNAEGKKATVAITGGTINGELDTRSYDPKTNELTSINDAAKATIKVTGGTFDKDPTKYVVEGSTVNENTDGTFGVEKAYLAKVGNTSYYTMDEAFKAQTASGEPIVMLRDYTTGSPFSSGSINRTVDLNGHTWTCTGTDTNSAAFEINYSNVTLTVKNGKVVSSQLVGLIPSAMGGTITYDNSSLVFDGVEMSTTACSGIETNGNNTNDTVTLKNSTLNVPNGFGIYFPSSGTLTIDNSTINAKTMGVQVCAGSLIVSGESTKITVTGDAVPKTENDGAIQDGAAISIVNRTGYKGLGAVTISEGTFVAKSGNQAIKAYDWNGTTESAFTAGGKVTIAEENVLSSSADTGITPPEGKAWVRVSVDPELYVIRAVTDCEAKIGEEYFATLADAIAVAQNGATVVLVKDVDTPAVTYVINKDLTIDLNGRTVTGSGYDGVFQITGEGAKVLIKNGDVVAVEQKGSAGKYAMAVWACAADCEVTLENLNVSQKITHTDDKQMDMIYTSGGTIIINSGSFESGTPAWTLNCKDEAYKAGTAKIIVNGGTFKGFDPMNGETEGKGTSFVNAEKHVGVNAAKNDDGTVSYSAVENMIAQVVDADGKSVKTFDKLSDALAAAEAEQTVKLLNSVTGEKYVEVEANVTLDLNGHSITDARLLYVTGQIIDTAVTKGTVKADGYYINRDNEYTPVYDSEKDGYSLFKLSVKTWWYATEKKVQFALDRDMADFSAAVALMNANSNGRRVKAQVEFSWVDSAQNVKGKQAFELGETYMSQYLANASNLAPYVTVKGLETIEGTVSVQVSFVISKDELGNELFTLYGNKGTIKQ